MSGLSFHWLHRGAETGKTPLLDVQGLTVRVGLRKVLTDINLVVMEGDQIRISGANGSGKSTLFNAIAGVEPARIVSGRIHFQGHDVTHLPTHERVALGIIYMRQSGNVFETLTVMENLRIALGEDGPNHFLQAFPGWAESIPLKKPAWYLSGGEKKKLAWWIVMLHANALLWMLDEPKAGVSSQETAMSAIPIGKTVLSIEHGEIP